MFTGSRLKKLLPQFLKRNKHISFLAAMLKPARNINDMFKEFQEKTDLCRPGKGYSQRMNMEWFLNNIFFQEIHVLNVQNSLNKTYIHFLNENQPPTYINFLSESSPNIIYVYFTLEVISEYDFIVQIADILVPQQPQIEAYVNKLKLASKRYIVEVI